ncbi:MAG: 4'-phosphopantetheinyl transferase family protein [Actinomycetota bacterium]
MSTGTAIQLWLVADGEPDGRDLERRLGVLSAEEVQRYRRISAPGAARRFAVARWLARTALSHNAEIGASEWRFAAGRHGRLEVAGPRPAERLRFNLSHTPGLVACVVCRDLDCGVDCEDAGRPVDVGALARRLPPGEAKALEAAPGEERTHLFLSLWTLKEAFAKARGDGVPVALRGVAFSIDGASIRCTITAGLHDDPSQWQFALLRPTPRHLVGLAVRSGASRRLPIVTRQAGPAGFDLVAMRPAASS